MLIGPKRKAQLAALREKNKKQRQEKTAAHATPTQSFPMVFARYLPPTQASHFSVALALPLLPIPTQATTTAAATVDTITVADALTTADALATADAIAVADALATADAIAAAQAQELAVKVLTTFASLEEERAQAHARNGHQHQLILTNQRW